tara:strand:+ start:107 stop:631 length:525 start_codon:yes stop_codon:yes gene_type:complete
VSADDIPGWDEPLDPEKLEAYRQWSAMPLEQRRAHSEASHGLLNGELAPLAAYIRGGWPIDGILAEQIAAAIEGPDAEGYALRMVSNDARKLKFDERDALRMRNIDVALFYRAEKIAAARAGWSGTEDEIFAKIRDRFGVGRSTALRAVSEFREEIGERYWNEIESSEDGDSLD